MQNMIFFTSHAKYDKSEVFLQKSDSTYQFAIDIKI